MLQMIIGSTLFAIVAGAAYVLWLGTVWLEAQKVPYHLLFGAEAVAYLLFGLDVLCFVVYSLGETFKLLRDIIRDIGGG